LRAESGAEEIKNRNQGFLQKKFELHSKIATIFRNKKTAFCSELFFLDIFNKFYTNSSLTEFMLSVKFMSFFLLLRCIQDNPLNTKIFAIFFKGFYKLAPYAKAPVFFRNNDYPDNCSRTFNFFTENTTNYFFVIFSNKKKSLSKYSFKNDFS